MAKKIDSIKHNKDKRVHIPSKEEAGYEKANVKVKSGKKIIEVPKNPVVHRGQDPELFWLDKYGNDDREDLLKVDIRSLYRHEHIAPETLIKNLYRIVESDPDQIDMFNVNELFGNALEKDELEKVSEYYKHHDGWTNRLIQGDSLLVMTSLLEREGMAGQVQTIYIDPPYGIRYGSNWQIKFNNLDVRENDENLSGEPEVIKAFRDTWELGIHSYLSYLRDRLIIARELLSESGGCFVQISDENVHLVRSIMDEVFGSKNFIVNINIQKTGGLPGKFLTGTVDYLIWYAKDIDKLKYRQLYLKRKVGDTSLDRYDMLLLPNGNTRRMSPKEIKTGFIPPNTRRYQLGALYSDGDASYDQSFEFKGKIYKPRSGKHWSTHLDGMKNLARKERIEIMGSVLRYRRFADDFNYIPLTDRWDAVQLGTKKLFSVQTAEKVLLRSILMSTDPGDLVLDPTCGSGTTAFVSELFGRRWITIDTSRIAINIAKQRLMTSVFPYFKLYDDMHSDIRQGFIYKSEEHITLKSLANEESPELETLFDRPEIERKKLRVSGPFTVETLQNFEPVSPDSLKEEKLITEESGEWEEKIKMHLLSTGVKNRRKNEQVIFTRVEILANPYLNAEGFYQTTKGEYKAYFLIGPRFGTVSKALVNEAVKECRIRGDANWLVILGFSFESDIEGGDKTMSLGNFEVTKTRIHDDLVQEGLKKKPSKMAASFVTIGEPDIKKHIKGKEAIIEILGMDIYDPIKDEVKPRNVSDIAYWMVDDDYDGSNFVVKQVFFCGGDKDEFNKWQKGLSDVAKNGTKRKAEKTLKIEIDDEAFDRLYGYKSHPIKIKKKDQKIAVRIISLFGEESTKVIKV